MTRNKQASLSPAKEGSRRLHFIYKEAGETLSYKSRLVVPISKTCVRNQFS